MNGFDLPRALSLLDALGAAAGAGTVHVLERTSSTNDALRRLANGGAPEGTVVLAEEQSAGRGRLGTAWHSPRGSGLYLSVLFRPPGTAADATRFTLLSAVAACEAARGVGAESVAIKWPNDLLWRGRKVAGTLAELRTSGAVVLELVVGTGFNVAQGEGDFPPELAGRAASLRMAAGGPVDRERLFALYVTALLEGGKRLRAGKWEAVRARWSALAFAASGGRVRVLPGRGAPPFEAVTEGIDATGALRVRDDGGALRTLSLGESLLHLEA
ncbi:MAG TPA: biotin--[acetyl-CoA-carboxylase] ligase [Candidatus Polarisedimenticolaceae bacterium]|nr:biotin--[acetyl-CoA-carboxylase] ligase [Candidatus Polarisedimenticolaceae bacterium]